MKSPNNQVKPNLSGKKTVEILETSHKGEILKERKWQLRGLKKLLIAESKRLEKIISVAQTQLKTMPEGTLRLSKTKEYIQYYYCTEENKSGKYIGKNNLNLVQSLAQKSYDERILQVAEKRLKQIDCILRDYEDDEMEEIFNKEHVERQRFIQTIEPTWEQRLKMWKDKEYQAKGFQEGTPLILTERGERVRSKTEKIMADSPEYARSMVRKIEAYENNGIFSGERLILTYETEQSILSTEKIAQMVERYLK